MSAAARKLRKYYEVLRAAYGPQQWWPARTPFEVIIGAYLTQNTAWRNVERSINNLREANALTVEGIRKTPLKKLQELIRPSGYMIRKSAALKTFVAFLDEKHSGSLDVLAACSTAEIREQLLALAGVGPETADAILLYALGHPVMVADEYLRRVLTRHRLVAEDVRYAAMKAHGERAFVDDPPIEHLQHLNEFHALIVMVGKSHCRGIPRCAGCPLAPLLPRQGPARAPARKSKA